MFQRLLLFGLLLTIGHLSWGCPDKEPPFQGDRFGYHRIPCATPQIVPPEGGAISFENFFKEINAHAENVRDDLIKRGAFLSIYDPDHQDVWALAEQSFLEDQNKCRQLFKFYFWQKI